MKHLWMTCLIAVSGACSDDPTTSADVDATAKPDGEDGEVSFSPTCPPLQVFTGVTCVSGQENAVCPGTKFCDACGVDVATSCTCVRTDGGREFTCDDPCATCTVNTPDVVDASEEAAPEVTHVWTSAGACTLSADGITRCFESEAENIDASSRPNCLQGTGPNSPGLWTTSCPTDGAIGYCDYSSERMYYYGSAAEAGAFQNNCENVGGGTWTLL